MQPEVAFLENSVAHNEFSIISEVFLCLSLFFFMWDHFGICQDSGGRMSTSAYLWGCFCPFMSIFIAGKCPVGGGGQGGVLCPTLPF